MKKSRGILLIVLIVCLGLSYIFSLTNSSDYNPLYLLLAIIGLISLVGIWSWKKWGVYLQIIVYTISLGIGLFFLQSPQVSKAWGKPYPLFVIWMIVWVVIPAVLGYIALKAKWKYFK